MTPAELREMCSRDSAIDYGYIYIKMPGKWGNKDTRTLAGNGSPVGVIAGDHMGKLIVRFETREVLAWLDKMEALL